MNRIGPLVLLVAGLLPSALFAQGPDAGRGTRFGIALGGISTVSLTVEVFDDSRSLEVALGTWSFHDVSLSAVGKQYFGAGAARPFVGAGLWLVAARPASPGERTGVALVLRAPVGVDWGFADRHAVGLAMNVNRGLLVLRSDPGDDVPMNERFVPLPELYYRFTK